MSYSKIQILGRRIDASQAPKLDSELIQIDESHFFELNNTRANERFEELEYHEDYICDIVFEDGSEWIGDIRDLHEISAEQTNRGAESEILTIGPDLASNSNRGVFDKIVRFFGLKRVNNDGMSESQLALNVDKKLTGEEGLFDLTNPNMPKKIDQLQETEDCLIMIHGTFSSVQGSYSKLWTEGTDWPDILNQNEGRVYGFQHYTLSKSPVQNAIDLLNKLPNNLSFSILSSSRGGLVADLICRCDVMGSAAFDEIDFQIYQREELIELNRLALEKNISVKRLTRVASPADGTSLLNRRLDLFLLATLAISNTISGKRLRLSPVLRALAMQTARKKILAKSFPGLEAMMPDSALGQVINNLDKSCDSELLVVQGGNKLGSNIKNTALNLICRLAFGSKLNDFVVDSASMTKGVLRTTGLEVIRIHDADINHMVYMHQDNSFSRQAVLKGINPTSQLSLSPDPRLALSDGDRGVGIAGFGAFSHKTVSQQKPIAIIIPGIMGSHLESSGSRVYLNFSRIGLGQFVTRLKHNARSVKPTGVIKRYYKPLWDKFISQGYDCVTFEFDWRLDIDKEATRLERFIGELRSFNQPVSIVAHSMGGILTRAWMRKFPSSWKILARENNSRLVMLGVPWKGSHLIMEALTGHLSRVQQIAKIDLIHRKSKIVKTVQNFKGMYNLLPTHGDYNYENTQFWTEIDNQTAEDFPIPPEDMMRFFAAYKTSINQHILDSEDVASIYYIAGKDHGTTCDYRIKESSYGNELQYLKTEEGDGSVSWELGIPTELPTDHVYYCNEVHMNLACAKSIRDDIFSLVDQGLSSSLDSFPLRSSNRGGDNLQLMPRETSADVLDEFFDVPGEASDSYYSSKIEVDLYHGDLIHGSYPVMLGHFSGDGIMYAENALNEALNGALVERRDMGIYPNDVGQNLILHDEDQDTKGAIIAGMGRQDELTGFLLSQTVENAMLVYALHLRDNKGIKKKSANDNGVSTVCIASGYGGLSTYDSLQAIFKGISKANIRLNEMNEDLPLIEKVQIIEIYEDKAKQIQYALKEILKGDNRSQISYNKELNSLPGKRVRNLFTRERTWWMHMSCENLLEGKTREEAKLKFKLSTRRSRVEAETNQTDRNIIDYLLKIMSEDSQWNDKLSKTLFEILTPNQFKSLIRDQFNTIWQVDEYTAGIPWEMFHDSDIDDQPTFVNTGIIRQLVSNNSRSKPQVVVQNSALIIADPIYEKLSQLPGAKAEGQEVSQLLEGHVETLDTKIGSSPKEVLKALFTQKNKILHLAGHGIFQEKKLDENCEESEIISECGIVIGDMLISPALINQMSVIPEFAFINCCYSGTTEESAEYRADRYKLAGNIGSQLIEMGVKAVVVTGWAVNDAAALSFAREFYRQMLNGARFGDATRAARFVCYSNHQKIDTWAAYQCYGDPWYKFSFVKSRRNLVEVYQEVEEAIVDYRNLYEDAKLVRAEDDRQRLIHKLKQQNQRLGSGSIADYPSIVELQANIYESLDILDKSIEIFERLLEKNDANFKVKSLEKYCDVYARKSYQSFLNSKKLSDKNLGKKEIKKLKKKFKSLMRLGSTSERHSLHGSLYKKLAHMCRDNAEERRDYLERTEVEYSKAYKLIPAVKVVEGISPLSDALTAHILLKGPEGKPDYLDGKSINDLVSELIFNLDKPRRKGKGFSEKIATVKLDGLGILIDKNPIAKSEALADMYENIWSKEGTISDLRKEIMHYEFVVDLIGNSKKTKLKNAKKALEYLLVRLNRLLI